MSAWFVSFMLNALVDWVNRRMLIRIVRFGYQAFFHLKRVRRGVKSHLHCGPCGDVRFNYMLIDDAIKAAVRAGRLIPAKPSVAWAPEPRAFLMCMPLHTAIQIGRTETDPKLRDRWAQLEASISYFIEGRYVTDDLMKQLKPPKFEHWELRSRKPRPSLRIFGRFIKPNVFVGTHVTPRPLLGGMWSSQFEHEKLVCEEYWSNTGLLSPFSDSPRFRYDKYITENASRKVKVP